MKNINYKKTTLEYRWNMTSEEINRRMQYMRTEWGMSNLAIANELGCSVPTIDKRIGKPTNGEAIKIAQNTAKKIAEKRSEYGNRIRRKYIPIMEMYREAGLSNVEIAKKTGFCDQTVRKFIGNNPDEIRLMCVRVGAMKRKLRNFALAKIADENVCKTIHAENSVESYQKYVEKKAV